MSTVLSGGDDGLGNWEQPVCQPPDAAPHRTPVHVHVLGEVRAHGRAAIAQETVECRTTNAYHRGDQAQKHKDQAWIRTGIIYVQVTTKTVWTLSDIDQQIV